MRGRIFALASSWSGRPLSLIAIVSVAERAPGLVGSTPVDLADLDAGDPHRRAGVDAARVAERRLDLVGLVENGTSFVKPRYVTTTATTITAMPTAKALGPRSRSHGPPAGAMPVGSAENVWPSGTRARPLNVGPWLPGVRGSTTMFSVSGEPVARRSG